MLMMKSVRDGANQLGAWLMVSSVLLMLAINLTPVQAQSAPPVLCGNVIDGFPPSAAGEYFYSLSGIRDPGALWRFMRVTATESTELVAPFSPRVVQTMVLPHVSPDGRLMAFIPIVPATSLTIWDMTTDATVTIELSLEEAEHLDSDYAPFHGAFRRLEWISDQTLAIRYYDDSIIKSSTRLLREIEFQVGVNPLSIQRGNDTITQFPNLPLPPENCEGCEPEIYLSPLGRYAAQLTYQFLQYFYDVPRVQVFDLENGTVVFDAVPSKQETALDEPRWLADESGFFYAAAPPQHEVYLNFAVRTARGFVLDPTFFSTISQAIGGSAVLDTDLIPTLNPSGDGMGFAILVYGEAATDRYIAVYVPHDSRLTILCNPLGYEIPNMVYPFWSPDGRYFGYWNLAGAFAFDLQTGDIYRLPDAGREWVGWVGSTEQ